MKPDETLLDLYAGMGGLSQGFKPFFNVMDAVDLWADACKTYALNHNSHIHNTSVSDYLARCIPKDYEGLLFNGIVGGPPCQEFSVLNRHADLHSARANQLFVFLEVVKALKPAFAMIENVATLPKEMKERAASDLSKIGYYVTHKTVLAYNYGSVQLRRRWILTASKSRHIFPNPVSNTRTAKEIFSNNSNDQDIQINNLNEIQIGSNILDQLKLLPKGKWVALPGQRWKVYYIIDTQKPLPAIVNLTKMRIVKPDCSRCISMNELKLAQGFSESYKMAGRMTSQAQQLANAVPVELARSFAQAFYHAFHPNASKIEFYLHGVK